MNDAASQPATPYELIGGEAGVRELVDRFYDLMALDEEFARIRALHPPQLQGSREKLFLFLSGWLGGPPLYAERIGHPMLRARHLPFAIGLEERDLWLACMSRAMDDAGIDAGAQRALARAFFQTADWMRNK